MHKPLLDRMLAYLTAMLVDAFTTKPEVTFWSKWAAAAGRSWSMPGQSLGPWLGEEGGRAVSAYFGGLERNRQNATALTHEHKVVGLHGRAPSFPLTLPLVSQVVSVYFHSSAGLVAMCPVDATTF